MKKRLQGLITSVLIGATMLLSITLAACDKKDIPEDIPNQSTSYEEVAKSNDVDENAFTTSEEEYYGSLIADGDGLIFDVTVQEFLDKYNENKSTYEDKNYKDIEVSDFFHIENGVSDNGVVIEVYGCSQTIFGTYSDLIIAINKEANSDRITSISFGIKNNKYIDMYYSNDFYPHIMTQYRLLISTITGCSMTTAQKYTDEIFQNGKQTNTFSTYDKGVALFFDTSNTAADWYRIIPCTEEQYHKAIEW